MPTEAVEFSEVQVTRNGVVVMDGYGLRISVHRRHLVLSDGIGRNRRFSRFSRATSGIKRIVMLGRSGMITLDALRWINDVSIGIIQVDNGSVVAAFGPTGLDDARLRRAQALAAQSGRGLDIARTLLMAKVKGQLEVLTKIPGAAEAQKAVTSTVKSIEKAASLGPILQLEAQAAAAYWEALADVPVAFSRVDLARVPVHWLTLGHRHSPITGSPRLAANPANAILNYLYAILEAETRIACLAVGLDPGLGIVHADLRARDSMVLDVMEAVRPKVERFILDFLKTQLFRTADFRETSRGQCILLPPLSHTLSSTAIDWGQRVAPVVEEVVRMLGLAQRPRIARLPTPLTQANRSLGREPYRRRSRVSKASSLTAARVRRCSQCGNETPRGRSFCDICLVTNRSETLAKLESAGATAIARLAAQGKDPAHGGKAAPKRSASNIRRMREADVWDRNHPERPNPNEFRRQILPHLQQIPLKQIVKFTGLSLRYCSLIRRGLYVPHPRHWPNFFTLTHKN